MYYTGIGSRSAPQAIINEMKDVAGELALIGYTLRSGGADGADTAFEVGCDTKSGHKNIYLPWKNFNNNKSVLYNCYTEKHKEIAERTYGKRWQHIKDPVKKLMTRNVCQVIGHHEESSNSDFLICWTPDGCEQASKRNIKTGGTGQAIALADSLSIPVINMANINWENKLKQYLNTQALFS